VQYIFRKEILFQIKVDCKVEEVVDYNIQSFLHVVCYGAGEEAKSERDFAVGKILLKLITCDPKRFLLLFRYNMKHICLRYEVCNARVTPKNIIFHYAL
jgi:hypothetical protein